MQDQLRLGFKRSWVTSSHEEGLPSVYPRGAMQYNSLKSCNYERDYFQGSHQGQLKHIRRNPEDGKAQLETQVYEKPSTQHGKQISDASEYVKSNQQAMYYHTANSEKWQTQGSLQSP